MSSRVEWIEEAADRTRVLHWLGLQAIRSATVWAVRDSGCLVAAATLMPDPVPRGWLRVAEEHRGQGLGHLLWLALHGFASVRGLSRIEALKAVDEHALPWVGRHQLQVTGTITEFSASLRDSLPRQRLAWARVVHRMPAQSRIISLRQAQAEGLLGSIAAILAPAVGGDPARWLSRAEQSLRTLGPPDFDPECSVILMVNGQVVGAQTARFDPAGPCWFNEAITIIPEYRRGWASIALRVAAGSAKERAALVDEVRFRARDDHLDTLRMAHHLGARKRWSRSQVIWMSQ